VRQRRRYENDPIWERWSTQKLAFEMRLLKWLRKNSDLPVPRYIAGDDDQDQPTFLVMSQLPGSLLFNRWGLWNETVKVSLFAEFAMGKS
jgi:aminoglycoside phosphotransferase